MRGAGGCWSQGDRDEDQTVMSRSLIDQMEEIQLFSHVLRVGSEERAEDLLEQGAAAVITIPQFFFYELCALFQLDGWPLWQLCCLGDSPRRVSGGLCSFMCPVRPVWPWP